MLHRIADRISTDRLPRRVAVVVLVAGMLLPTAAWARNTFTDVPFSNTFHDDIDWMAETGVTRGCNPPANDQYCPDQFVTRAQMAAFMRRLETNNVFVTPEDLAALPGQIESSGRFVTPDQLAEETEAIDGLTPVVVFSTRQSTDTNGIRRIDMRAPVTGVTNVRVATGQYDITMAGLPYSTSERVVCTPISSQDRALTLTSNGDKMRVNIFDINTGVPADAAFTCAVYN